MQKTQKNIIFGLPFLHILDYCQRAYWRQNARITASETDVLKRFHALLDQYYYEGRQAEKGLPTVADCEHIGQ